MQRGRILASSQVQICGWLEGFKRTTPQLKRPLGFFGNVSYAMGCTLGCWVNEGSGGAKND